MHDRWQSTVHAMGMPFRVTVDNLEPGASAEQSIAAFHDELVWADQVFSLWRDDSVLAMFNRGELGIDDGPPELLEVLQACEWYRSATDGAFDARGPAGLDPTGLVKGWAVQRASRELVGIGAAWMVDAAGDVLASGALATGPWRVGIADPRVVGDPSGTAVLDVVELGAGRLALATSGSAQRGPHIWDPATGAAARHVLQASVVGESLVEADVWATAIVAAGIGALEGVALAGLEALVVVAERDDGSFDTVATEGWPSIS